MSETGDRLNTLEVAVSSLLAKVPRRPRIIEIEDIQSLTIKTKSADYVPLYLWKPQLKVLAAINDAIRANKPCRIIVLKARKCGMSTFMCAIVHHLAKRFGLDFAIIGHGDKASNNLYSIISLMYIKDPELQGTPPPKKNKQEMKYPGGGSIRVLTAGSPDSATSMTLHGYLATEHALWCKEDKGKSGDQMRSLTNCVSEQAPFTFGFIESTARPESDFQERWEQAEKKENNLTPVFIGLFDIPEYSEEFESVQDKINFSRTLTKDEERWILPVAHGGYGATLEQVKCSRLLKATKCRGTSPEAKEADFNSEYPVDPIVAFQRSHRAVFSQKWCFKRKHEVAENPGGIYSPIFTGNILFGNIKEMNAWVFNDSREADLREMKEFFLREEIGGQFRVWAWPEAQKQYVGGEDVSEGIEIENRRTDESAVVIRERLSGFVVATWKGKISTWDFGMLIACIGRIYHTNKHAVYMVPESNSIGAAVCASLWEHYPHGSIHEMVGGTNIVYQNPLDRLGDKTTSVTKPLQIDAFARALNENQFNTHEWKLLDEMQRSFMDKNGRVKTGGKDLLMAAIKSEVARAHAPHWIAPPEREKTEAEIRKEYYREKKRKEKMQTMALKASSKSKAA